MLMCPASYQRKGLCKAVNCSLSYNPITTCLKVDLLLPYSVAGRVKILSGLVSLGLYLSSSFTWDWYCGAASDETQCTCNVDTLLRYRLGCVWKMLCCFFGVFLSVVCLVMKSCTAIFVYLFSSLCNVFCLCFVCFALFCFLVFLPQCLSLLLMPDFE